MLSLTDIAKVYGEGKVKTRAVNGVSLHIGAGEFVAIMGPSGCGKSTLLNILGLIDTPSEGSFLFMGEEIARANEKRLTQLQREHTGFVFQNFNLIEELTAAENVEVALIYRGVPGKERKQRVAEALEQVGLGAFMKHHPARLSGGQQQRVAVARALVSRPKLILADEPTGSLDQANGEVVMGLLTDAIAGGATVVMATHSHTQAGKADRVLHMLDGRLEGAHGAPPRPAVAWPVQEAPARNVAAFPLPWRRRS
jgi:putative ABC transport system ATP-binding protein